MSNFVRGWYKNSEATQKALFDLGYGWEVDSYSSFKIELTQEVRHLDQGIVHTNTNGTLTYSEYPSLGIYKGTQIDILNPTLTLERIQEALDTFREMDAISGGVMATPSKDVRQDIYTGKDGFISVEGWVDKYLTKDKDEPKKLDKDLYLEIKKNLETALSELEKLT